MELQALTVESGSRWSLESCSYLGCLLRPSGGDLFPGHALRVDLCMRTLAVSGQWQPVQLSRVWAIVHAEHLVRSS